MSFLSSLVSYRAIMNDSKPNEASTLEPSTESQSALGSKVWWLLGAASSLGLIGSELLNAPWSLNWALWMTLLVIVAAWFSKFERIKSRVWWLWGVALLLTWCNVWRELFSLHLYNFLTSLACIGLAAAWSRQPNFGAGFVGLVWAWMNALSAWTFGWIITLFKDTPWYNTISRFDQEKWLPLARGLLIVIPMLVVFGWLLTSADAAFSVLVRGLFDWQLNGNWLWWLVRFASISAFVIGLLRLMTFGVPPLAPLSTPRFGMTELVMVLGALNLLFGAFIVVQFGYFFGGSEQITALTGLTFAEYARKGFNELIQVVLFSLPVLIAALHISLEQPRAHRVVRWLSSLTLVCLGVMLFSAWQRLGLYRDAYGLTETRFYTAVFLIWLAAMLVWYATTTLRNRYTLFPIGAFIGGLVALVALNVLNPAALIVNSNLARVTKQNFDLEYAVDLGADAVPTLLNGMGRLTNLERNRMQSKLRARWVYSQALDWRSFNFSRERARGLIHTMPSIR